MRLRAIAQSRYCLTLLVVVLVFSCLQGGCHDRESRKLPGDFILRRHDGVFYVLDHNEWMSGRTIQIQDISLLVEPNCCRTVGCFVRSSIASRTTKLKSIPFGHHDIPFGQSLRRFLNSPLRLSERMPVTLERNWSAPLGIEGRRRVAWVESFSGCH